MLSLQLWRKSDILDTKGRADGYVEGRRGGTTGYYIDVSPCRLDALLPH